MAQMEVGERKRFRTKALSKHGVVVTLGASDVAYVATPDGVVTFDAPEPDGAVVATCVAAGDVNVGCTVKGSVSAVPAAVTCTEPAVETATVDATDEPV